MSVSRETPALLDRYLEAVRAWNVSINLISQSDLPNLESRHLKDALSLAPLIPDSFQTLADLGSGGGFPAVPTAILKPDLEIHALESDQRKVAFLRFVKGQLQLANFHPHCTRIEAWTQKKVDAISARACASLDILIAYAIPLLHTSSRCYFFKGQRHTEEIEIAKKAWTWDMEIHSNPSAPESVILELWNIRPASNNNLQQ